MTQPKFDTEQIISEYNKLEPGKADTWNPVGQETQLLYRLSLLHSLTQSLQLSDIPLELLKVLDIGCGNGRSTRVYIDLGLQPEQLMALEVREGTLELFKKLNPAIPCQVYDGNLIPCPDESFNWIQVAGVFSSIKSEDSRKRLVDEINQKLQPGGYIFYYDLYRFNPYAGKDRIMPQELFSGFKTIWYSTFREYEFLPLTENIGMLFNSFSLEGKRKFYHKIRRRIKGLIFPFYEVLLVQKLSK